MPAGGHDLLDSRRSRGRAGRCRGQLAAAHEELLKVEVGGRGLVTSGGRFAGGGYGIVGAATGMAVASMLNNARMTAIDSFIRLTSRRTEMLLSRWKYRPETVRNSLTTIWVRHLATTRTPTVVTVPAPVLELPPAGPVDELEGLTRLHAPRQLTMRLRPDQLVRAIA